MQQHYVTNGKPFIQTSQPIRSVNDMLVSIDTIKWFDPNRKEVQFQESGSQHENSISTEYSINKVMTHLPRTNW